MNITTNSASTIGRNFLEDMDKFILHKYQILKCKDVAKIYFDFFLDLKDFRGNSAGFTGLSEFLIFRFLYHLLGGSFKRNWINKDSVEFVSRTNGGFRLRQSLPLDVNGKKYRPDVAVFQGDLLKGVVQIKVYLTLGRSEILKEMKILKEIKHANPKMKAVLIIFAKLPSKGKELAELQKQRDKNYGWFDYVILRGNNELLGKSLLKCLGI